MKNILKQLRTAWLEFCLDCRVLFAAVAGFAHSGESTPVGRLYATVTRADGSVEDLGLICTKVVTDAGVAYLVDALQNITEPENFKYHGYGTGTTAESASQTALVTEIGTRATGSQTEGASANIYRTVGTITAGGTAAVTEHGIFSASSTGTMLDRSVFAAINVVINDQITFTYELTLPSGS